MEEAVHEGVLCPVTVRQAELPIRSAVPSLSGPGDEPGGASEEGFPVRTVLRIPFEAQFLPCERDLSAFKHYNGQTSFSVKAPAKAT